MPLQAVFDDEVHEGKEKACHCKQDEDFTGPVGGIAQQAIDLLDLTDPEYHAEGSQENADCEMKEGFDHALHGLFGGDEEDDKAAQQERSERREDKEMSE